MDAHEILRHIIQNPEPETVAPELLHKATQMSEADCGAYVNFASPQQIIHSNKTEDLSINIENLTHIARGGESGVILFDERVPDEFAPDYQCWAWSPLVLNSETAGMVFFLYQSNVAEDIVDDDQLRILIDGLCIVTAFAKQKAEFQKTLHNKNQFFRVVTHDMRTPLQTIQGYAELLESKRGGTLTEKQKYYQEKILDGIAELDELTDNVQDAGIYDPDTGFYQLLREPCNIRDIVEDLVEFYTVPAQKQDLTLTTEFDDIPDLNIDVVMIERAIKNLIDNAVSYTPDGGKVHIYVRQQEEDIVVSVEDTGTGIPEEDQKNIFDQYFRGRREEHKHVKGSGLGLFIVESAAFHHGGRVSLESEEGEGSTFHIHIPLSDDNRLT